LHPRDDASQGRLLRGWMKLYMRRIVPLLARVFGRTRDLPKLMRYNWDTIEACVRRSRWSAP